MFKKKITILVELQFLITKKIGTQ